MDLEALEKAFDIEITEEASKIHIVLKDFPIPSERYNLAKTDVLITTDASYPKIALDMFWTNPELLLKDGSIPKNAECMETHLNKQWRRFSYHPYRNTTWNPSKDNVDIFVEHIRERFRIGN